MKSQINQTEISLMVHLQMRMRIRNYGQNATLCLENCLFSG